jgi:hypothetical protein
MATETIKWSYDTMFKWYAKQENINGSSKDIYTYVYESQRAKKNAKVQPFITLNMVCIGKSPVQSATLFPNGLYTVIERNTDKTKSKWLFFVYPKYADCDGKNILFGDHFTFCQNDPNENKSIHFHRTLYICTVVDGILRYRDDKDKDYFADNIELPRKGTTESIIKNPDLAIVKPKILDLMRYPWKRSSDEENSTETMGGAKRRPKQVAFPVISQVFTDLWTRCQFKSMVAFGFPVSDGVAWTVSFVRKGRRPNGRLEQAYVFTTPTPDEATFQNTLAALAEPNETTYDD